MALEWAPIAAAAPAMGVSPRTLKRRVATGAVASKLENGRRLVAVPSGTLGPRNGTVVPVTKGQKTGPNKANEREIGPTATGPEGQLAQGQAGTEGPNGVAQLIEQRDRDRAEIAFLRSTIEQHQRSEAELRQSLREALRAMPKAITAGAAESSPEAAKPRANGAGEPRDGAAAKRPEIAPEREEAGLSYGELADWLEAQVPP